MSYDYNKILKVKPLTPEQEVEHFRAYREQGNELSFKILVESNLRFVLQIARKNMIRPDETSLDDLFSEGSIGLITAIQKFDYTRGFKLISYGVWWIRQSILAYKLNRGHITIPQNVKGDYNKMMRFEQKYVNEHFMPPSKEKIALELDITVKRVEKIRQNISISVVSYDVKDEEGYSLLDTLESKIEIKGNLEKSYAKEKTDVLLNKLSSEREKEMLKLYYGFNGNDPMTYSEIGEEFDITGSRVAQILQKAIKKLRRLDKVNINSMPVKHSIPLKKKPVEQMQLRKRPPTKVKETATENLHDIKERIAKIIRDNKLRIENEEKENQKRLKKEQMVESVLQQEQPEKKSRTIKEYVFGKIFGRK